MLVFEIKSGARSATQSAAHVGQAGGLVGVDDDAVVDCVCVCVCLEGEEVSWL